MSDDAFNIPPGPTPTGYQRTQGGGFKWMPPTPEQLAKLLPQYYIECLLGRGGMGAVYKGTQKSLGRPVAIKILPPEVDDEDTSYTARFKNEARIMARLSHPGIVAVFDFGETSDGQLYIVMEYIDGSDVAKMVLSQGKLPPEHALAITAHVCDALGYAHANGIIHRDIKPANILINMDGAVKVADFGLAKLDDPGTSGLTKSGMAMGTPDFVAPETLMLGTQADGRADLYAVGVMLYQMLTGQLPRGAFDLPSTLSGTDRRFDAIVMKAMKYDRAERYQSSAEIRRDLDVILTAPLIESGGESSAAIPKQSLQQKPVARGPQQPQQKAADAPAPNHKSQIVNHKSKTQLFIGIGVAAALAIGAFVMIGGKKEAKPSAQLSPLSGTSVPPVSEAAQGTVRTPSPSAPVKAREEPKPAPVVVSSPPKPETPKPSPVKKEESKPVAAAAPAMPAAPPTPSAPIPASSPPPPTLSALDQRLTALDTGFQAAVERDAGAAFKANIAALDKLYLTALDRALATATSGGKLEEALALREEKQRIEKGQGVPSEVDESTLAAQPPATLKTLRQTYRSTTAQHEATKLKAMQPLYDKYDQALAAVQTELTKANQLDDAMRVKTVREQIAVTRSGGLPPAVVSPIANTPSGSPPSSVPATGSTLLFTDSKDFTNSLGMKFVKVSGTDILMCIHETRKKDYTVFAAETPGLKENWKGLEDNGIPVSDGDDHPAVRISWEDAKAFCAWLSKKEGRAYRLPTDMEWSFAIGIGRNEKFTKDSTPESLSNKTPDYMWGTTWPPPKGVANLRDMATKAKMPDIKTFIDGYEDGYATTAPVMSFKPNRLGIYDLIGNAVEWCEDWYNAGQKSRVGRGGSWGSWHGDEPRSARRFEFPYVDAKNGFRVVVDTRAPSGTSGAAAKPATPTPTPPAAPAPAPAAAAKSDFTNSLGMKFVKISGTKVMFCIHETRYKDYSAFDVQNPGLDRAWMKQNAKGFTLKDRTEDHPAINVGWDDAKAFCAWLSKKEGKIYRLPTDEEWSYAVGIGRDEKRKKDDTPATVLRVKEYPWNAKWPPPKGSGNYRDESYEAAFDSVNTLKGYDDSYPTTAPVMSFKPNRYGLYDMGGNIAEWCEDWSSNTRQNHVLRGGCWMNGGHDFELLSSYRDQGPPTLREGKYGFRIVVETTE